MKGRGSGWKREEAGERGREGERGKGGWRGGTMTLQRAKNLIHVKQHYGVSFCKENIFLISIYITDMAI